MREPGGSSGGPCRRASLLRRIVLVTWATVIASGAGAQAILWQTVPTSQVGANGLGLAYLAPGVVFAAGSGPMFTPAWVERFSAAGTRFDAGLTPPPGPNNGNVVYWRERATAIAPGPDGAVLAGWTEECRSLGPGPPTFCLTSAWLERHTQTGRQWRSPAGPHAAVAADATGVYVAGLGAHVQKFDVAGNLQWHWNPALVGGLGLAVASHAAGGVVVAGASDAGALLQRLDAGGTARWPSAIVGALGAATRLERVALNPAGLVWAAGTRASSIPGVRDIVVAKFDAEGALLWTRTRIGVVSAAVAPIADAAEALAVDAHDNAIVVASASTAAGFVAWTAKYDAAGNLLWNDSYGTAAGGGTRAVALAVDARDQVYVGGTGGLASGSTTEGFVRKLGPGGTAMWTVQQAGSVDDVTVGAADEVFVLANRPSGVALARLDPGAAEGAPPPTLLLTLPPGALVAGVPTTLAATIRGATAVAPTGVVTFRVNGVDVCYAVVLRPATATASTAPCALPQGLPAGSTLVEVDYGGDANNAATRATASVFVAADAATEVPTLHPAALGAVAVLLLMVAAPHVRRRQ